MAHPDDRQRVAEFLDVVAEILIAVAATGLPIDLGHRQIAAGGGVDEVVLALARIAVARAGREAGDEESLVGHLDSPVIGPPGLFRTADRCLADLAAVVRVDLQEKAFGPAPAGAVGIDPELLPPSRQQVAVGENHAEVKKLMRILRSVVSLAPVGFSIQSDAGGPGIIDQSVCLAVDGEAENDEVAVIDFDDVAAFDIGKVATILLLGGRLDFHRCSGWLDLNDRGAVAGRGRLAKRADGHDAVMAIDDSRLKLGEVGVAISNPVKLAPGLSQSGWGKEKHRYQCGE